MKEKRKMRERRINKRRWTGRMRWEEEDEKKVGKERRVKRRGQ